MKGGDFLMELELWIIWIIIAVIFAILELLTNSFILICFTVGAILACIFDFLNVSLYGQILVFLLVSFILTLYTRPLAKKFLESKHTHKTNLDSTLGTKGVAITDINNVNNAGQVKLKGEIWSAISKEDTLISKDSLVIVNEIKGVTLIVSKITE
ncbi:MAG: hypothetical protein A2Y24_00125 [Clostridiales bacterium GWE2_32_10]|nr:MAG: hypothetical protein A2Y24_00125 [Clostridiales bacterium GWE2_32_10]HBY20031.1 hypothetical protein [Clostridiales bacterium]